MRKIPSQNEVKHTQHTFVWTEEERESAREWTINTKKKSQIIKKDEYFSLTHINTQHKNTLAHIHRNIMLNHKTIKQLNVVGYPFGTKI